MLSKYNPAKQYLRASTSVDVNARRLADACVDTVGATTEAYNQLDYFGRMAFGGGMSRIYVARQMR